MPKSPRHTRKRGGQRRFEPLFEGTVRDLASDGRGVVGHPDGRTFLVSGVWLGEAVRVQPTGQRGSTGFGVAAAILEAAPERRTPPCPHHGFTPQHCGGCPWQFVDYTAQCRAKHQRIADLLGRMAVDSGVLQPLVPAPSEWHYRNRAQFKTDGERLGYLPGGSHQIVDVEHCGVLSPVNANTLAGLRARLPEADWRPVRRARARWHTIDIDDAIEGFQLDRRLSFRQGNSAQNRVMQDWLRGVVQPLDRAAPVVELFCGDGNFTGVLAEHFQTVLGVEGDREALDRLDGQGLEGVSTKPCNLFEPDAVSGLVRRLRDTRILVLDPPRDGLPTREILLGAMKKLEVILYISCDPATWARDCADFLDRGFALTEVVPLDLFPQTPHVELLSFLERR